jgi:hypothetical protein
LAPDAMHAQVVVDGHEPQGAEDVVDGARSQVLR